MISNAWNIKNYYRELLKDEKEHPRTELFAYARSRAPQGTVFTDGMLTGALKTLVSDEAEYQCVSRGVYQKTSGEKEESQPCKANVVQEYRRILENALSDMENKVQANPFDMLNLTDSDREGLMQIRKCMDMMRDTLNHLPKN